MFKVDTTRVRKDLEILIGLERKGAIRGVDYKIGNGPDNWIIIFGALELPIKLFNLKWLNIKLPVPPDIYHPTSRGRFRYYDLILVDSQLRTKTRNGWELIDRQFDKMYPDEVRRGWNFLCCYPNDCREETDIRAILAVAQNFLLDRAGKGSQIRR